MEPTLAAVYSWTGDSTIACWIDGGSSCELHYDKDPADSALDTTLRRAHLFEHVLIHIDGPVRWHPDKKRFECGTISLAVKQPS